VYAASRLTGAQTLTRVLLLRPLCSDTFCTRLRWRMRLTQTDCYRTRSCTIQSMSCAARTTSLSSLSAWTHAPCVR
jgi:hypothetical protein